MTGAMLSSSGTNKTQATKASVKEFLSKIPDAQRKKDAEKVCDIMTTITGKKPVMWGPSIVGFDQVHYKYASGREGDVGAIGFSPRKASLTIYLVDGIGKYGDLLDKLGPHKSSMVCLYIRKLDDINLDVLREIIESSYRHVMQNKDVMHRT
jgi:hypothetical protein